MDYNQFSDTDSSDEEAIDSLLLQAYTNTLSRPNTPGNSEKSVNHTLSSAQVKCLDTDTDQGEMDMEIEDPSEFKFVPVKPPTQFSPEPVMINTTNEIEESDLRKSKNVCTF